MSQFAQTELRGWSRNAAEYDALILPATGQAFDPIENLGTINGLHLLEMASGAGYLAKQLSDKGAEVAAVDFAPEMIQIARKTILELQTPERRKRVLEERLREAEKHSRDGRFEMKNTARLFIARKPSR